MASNLKDIGANAIEDGVDDFVSSFLFRRMQNLTKPFLKDFESDSEFDGAMQSFIQTLSMGLTLYAYTKIMSFFFERGAKIAGTLWAYIVAGRLKQALANKLKNSSFKGNKAFKVLGLVAGTDRTAERIEVAKLVKDNVNSFDSHKQHFQNQFQGLDSKFDNFSISATGLKGSTDRSQINRFTHKTLTGTWKPTNADKKLYEVATGVKLSETGDGSWSKVYEQINKYNDFSKTVDGEITNLATTLIMALSKQGLVR